jgi:methyl-accepting chemotaxis protein
LALDARTLAELAEASSNANLWLNIAFLLQVIVGVLVAGLTWFIIQALFKPLDKVVATMQAVDMGNGQLNLTHCLAEAGEVEILSLAKGFNVFNGGIKDLMIKFGSVIGNLSTSSDNLSTIAEQTQTAATIQTDALDQVATAVEEMVATVQEVASNASAASSKAQDCEAESKKGQSIVQNSILTINKLSEEMTSASSAISNVENNSNTITTVVDVIKGIADQTNLLALNAAIEAARAGEQGRGFAVVADEVRNLAKRTQDSTEEIQAMIQNLQENSRIAVEAMETSNRQAELCVENTHQAGDSLNSIASSIDEITGMNLQIATASEQQSVFVDDISKKIHAV